MDGNTLAFIIALAKKISLKNGSIGIASIDSDNRNLIFRLANGQSYTVGLPIPQVDLDNAMKIDDYDKDKDGIIDICDFANKSKISNDSNKLNGEQAENYFNKVINNTDNIIEGEINKFLTRDEKEKLSSLSININELLDKKMDIDKYDSNSNGIIDKAETLDGLQVSINEINKLQGVKENIQKQINSLSNIGNFTGSANTYKDIAIVNSNPVKRDMIIVIKDETHKDTSTIYMYNGSAWIYSGTFTATIRDFSTDPINLYNETEGLLPQSKMNLQGIARTTDLNNKLDKVQGNKNNILIFNENGNVRDSGINIYDIQAKEHNRNDLYYTKSECDTKYSTKDELKSKIQNIDIKGIDILQNDVKQLNTDVYAIQKEIRRNAFNNKNILDKLSDDGTGLKYNGKEIGTNKEENLNVENLWSKFEL